MWLSGQQKRPADRGEGQVGTVTVGGSGPAVMLDRERRGLEVYAPAGYHWTPQAGQRVLVIQGQGEIPAIVGVHDGGQPGAVGISAGSVGVSGGKITLRAGGDAAVAGKAVRLEGQVYVNGETLENFIIRVVMGLMGGV